MDTRSIRVPIVALTDGEALSEGVLESVLVLDIEKDGVTESVFSSEKLLVFDRVPPEIDGVLELETDKERECVK